MTTTYRVTMRCDGSFIQDPKTDPTGYFKGRTGNAYPDFTCEVETIPAHEAYEQGYVLHPAHTAAMLLYPYTIRGEIVEYEVVEVKR